MIRIIADTTSSIPVEEAARLGIGYLPQIIVFGEKSYRDDNELSSEQFLELLKGSSALPKTAAPPPVLYNPIYEEVVKAGDTAIVLCPSSEMSGTFRSATVAAEDFPHADIRIIDTRTIGGGLATLVLKAVEMVNTGATADEIITTIKEMSCRERIFFLVDTLEYLQKGGRIGGAQALVGSLLQVKPILTVKDGRVVPGESQRTKRRALARIIELIQSNMPANPTDAQISIFHGGVPGEAGQLGEDIRAAVGVPEVRIYNMPPAIIVHAGPGVIAVSIFTDTPQ